MARDNTQPRCANGIRSGSSYSCKDTGIKRNQPKPAEKKQ